MEYYILMANNEIIGVFRTLLECLSLKPKRELVEPIQIQSVRVTENGEFKIQHIGISKDIYFKD